MGNEEFSMKNLKFLGIIALAVVIGFAFIACPGEEEEEVEPTVPDAVATFRATPDDKEVGLVWTAPAKDGGSAITGYEVTKDNWTTKVTKTAGQLTHVFTGLTNDVEVTFKVRALNEIGAGPEKEVKAMPTDVPVVIPPVKVYFKGTAVDAEVGIINETDYTMTESPFITVSGNGETVTVEWNDEDNEGNGAFRVAYKLDELFNISSGYSSVEITITSTGLGANISLYFPENEEITTTGAQRGRKHMLSKSLATGPTTVTFVAPDHPSWAQNQVWGHANITSLGGFEIYCDSDTFDDLVITRVEFK